MDYIVYSIVFAVLTWNGLTRTDSNQAQEEINHYGLKVHSLED